MEATRIYVKIHELNLDNIRDNRGLSMAER
jgi:hypothetical protein